MKIRNEYKQPNGAQTKINKNKKGRGRGKAAAVTTAVRNSSICGNWEQQELPHKNNNNNIAEYICAYIYRDI